MAEVELKTKVGIIGAELENMGWATPTIAIQPPTPIHSSNQTEVGTTTRPGKGKGWETAPLSLVIADVQGKKSIKHLIFLTLL